MWSTVCVTWKNSDDLVKGTDDRLLYCFKRQDDMTKRHGKCQEPFVKCITVQSARYCRTVVLEVWALHSLFGGMSVSNFKSLQRVQNTLECVVLRRVKFEHITPALIDLHWLPVQYRVTYKLATLTYSIKWSGQASYLHELLQGYQPTYSLRSASHDLLATTRPDLLHLVPLDILQLPPWTLYHLISAVVTIITFKRRLKTFLFNQVFAI